MRLWSQYILTLRGSAHQKTRDFDMFFQKVGCGAENLVKTASFFVLRRARKINLVGRPNKKVVKIFDIFFENSPPRENPRSAPTKIASKRRKFLIETA